MTAEQVTRLRAAPGRGPCIKCGKPWAAQDGAHGRCGVCYQRWRRGGYPPDDQPPRLSLKASDSGYSAARGVARAPGA